MKCNTMPNKNIAVGFVIYEPSQDQLDRIKEASSLGFSVYVYDNSPDSYYAKKLAAERANVIYLTCGKNVGLGRGVASVSAQAYYDRHTALLFFDQDTIFNSSTLDFINTFYKSNVNLSSGYSAIIFNSKNANLPKGDSLNIIRNVNLAINSGSLFYLESLKKLNWHNENYFVDCVDYEFCLNSKIHGFKIGEISVTPGFDHTSEQDDIGYKLFGRTYLMRAYSLNRVIDTCWASLKLLCKSFFSGQLNFFLIILKLLTVYIATQLFVNTFGWIFKKRIEVE